ncbi:MAG: hypothetical protein QXK93_08450 [Candidatus Bathyarchaeia archaeon]
MLCKPAAKGILAIFLASVLASSLINPYVKAERRLGVKVGDWVKYEFVTIVVTGKHPWMKFEVQNFGGTRVTVLWTLDPSRAPIPPNMPASGLTISWDITSSGSLFSYFIIHADAKVGDTVNIMGLLPLQIHGETTKTYTGADRKTVYITTHLSVYKNPIIGTKRREFCLKAHGP